VGIWRAIDDAREELGRGLGCGETSATGHKERQSVVLTLRAGHAPNPWGKQNESRRPPFGGRHALWRWAGRVLAWQHGALVGGGCRKENGEDRRLASPTKLDDDKCRHHAHAGHASRSNEMK
jgi:hypothetical protein